MKLLKTISWILFVLAAYHAYAQESPVAPVPSGGDTPAVMVLDNTEATDSLEEASDVETSPDSDSLTENVVNIETPGNSEGITVEAEAPQETAETTESSESGDASSGFMENVTNQMSLNGFVRADAFVPVEHDDDPFNFLGATFMLKANPSFGSNAAALAEMRVIADEAGRSIEVDLREAYIDLFLGPVDIRAGRQIIVWGRADGVNPTDNLSGKDMTVFSPDEDDRRLGSWALKVDWRLNPVTLTGILIPVFRPSQPLLGEFPSNITLDDPANPSPDIRNIEGALKLDVSLSKIDFSFSYFNGFGPFPGIELVQMTPNPPNPPQIDLRFAYDRRHVFGADFALALPGVILRGEGAYLWTEYEKGKTPDIEQSCVYYVLGIEANPIENLSLLFQFIEKIIPNFEEAKDYADPTLRMVAEKNQMVHRQQHLHLESLSTRISYSILQETLDFEILGVYNFYENDFYLRPKITYAINDAVSTVLGADIYYGSDDSLFGQIERYSSVFAEVKYSF